MNMKTSPTGSVKSKAEIEQINIENAISIVRLQLDKYTKILNSEAPEEVLIRAKTIVEREQKALEELREKHPEHFI